MKCPLGISNFLEEISSLSHSVDFLYFFTLISEEGFLISLCYSLELCIQMLISFLFPLLVASLLFTGICKASPDSQFGFLHFFSTGMILIPVSCLYNVTNLILYSSSGTLSIRSSPTKVHLSSQGYGFSSGHVWMWELDYKESWAPKNWSFWTVVLEKTLERPLDCKEVLPVHPKGNQSWVFIGRTDVEAETPILWPPNVKSWLICKDHDGGKDWGQEEKGMTEDEMVGWHYWLDGHWFGWTPGVGDGQGGLECCDSRGGKVSDTTEQLNWSEPLKSRASSFLCGKVNHEFSVINRYTNLHVMYFFWNELMLLLLFQVGG